MSTTTSSTADMLYGDHDAKTKAKAAMSSKATFPGVVSVNSSDDEFPLDGSHRSDNGGDRKPRSSRKSKGSSSRRGTRGDGSPSRSNRSSNSEAHSPKRSPRRSTRGSDEKSPTRRSGGSSSRKSGSTKSPTRRSHHSRDSGSPSRSSRNSHNNSPPRSPKRSSKHRRGSRHDGGNRSPTRESTQRGSRSTSESRNDTLLFGTEEEAKAKAKAGMGGKASKPGVQRMEESAQPRPGDKGYVADPFFVAHANDNGKKKKGDIATSSRKSSSKRPSTSKAIAAGIAMSGNVVVGDIQSRDFKMKDMDSLAVPNDPLGTLEEEQARSSRRNKQKEDEKKKKKRKRILLLLLLLLLLIGGGVAAYFLLRKKDDPVVPVSAGVQDPTAAPIVSATNAPSGSPSGSPSIAPTVEPIRYEPPSEEDCLAIFQNRTILEENVLVSNFGISFDVTLESTNSSDGAITRPTVEVLLDAIQKKLLPPLAGCDSAVSRRLGSAYTVRGGGGKQRMLNRLTNTQYSILNAFVNGQYEPEMDCKETEVGFEETCFRVAVDLTIILRRPVKFLDIVRLIADEWRSGENLVTPLEIDVPFFSVKMVQADILTPTVGPTVMPTNQPSLAPSDVPSDVPSDGPGGSGGPGGPSVPTPGLTSGPVPAPTSPPTGLPSLSPIQGPTATPTTAAPVAATISPAPSHGPSSRPSTLPSAGPSMGPTVAPVVGTTPTPTESPSFNPTLAPNVGPSPPPSANPTADSSAAPSGQPSAQPVAATPAPVVSPTVAPVAPTEQPVPSPSANPSSAPSGMPSASPSAAPTTPLPSSAPSSSPSSFPSFYPTPAPTTAFPSAFPTKTPTPCACSQGSFFCGDNVLDNLDRVGCGSCEAEDACVSMETSSSADPRIGEESCTAPSSCEGVQLQSIGNDSCTARESCKNRDLYVENSSCTGRDSCGLGGGDPSLFYRPLRIDPDDAGALSVGSESCTDEYSCFSYNGTVGDESCTSSDSCSGRGELTIGEGSCQRPRSCTGIIGFATDLFILGIGGPRWQSTVPDMFVASNSCKCTDCCRCMEYVGIEGACNTLGECCKLWNPTEQSDDLRSKYPDETTMF